MGNNHFMKSPFLLFLTMCFVFISIVILPNNENHLLKYDFESKNVSYCFYTDKFSAKTSDTYTIKSGVYDIVCCEYANADFVKKEIGDCLFGESLCVKNATKTDIKSTKKIAKNSQKICEFVGDTEIYYCYNVKFSKFVMVNDKKINFQIAISKDRITIGYPIILGEY